MSVRLEKIFKIYATAEIETTAINGVDLSIAAEEFIVLKGASGCGKSSLLSIIGLLEKPSKGTMFVDDVNVSGLSDDELAGLRGRQFGFIFQSFHLAPQLTVAENIELPLTFHNDVSKTKRKEQSMHWLDAVGLSSRRNHYPDQLSGGQQQRAAIARALVSNPKVILADEPTGNLDSKNSIAIMDILLGLNKSGTSVLLVTHDEKYASIGTRLIEMSDGMFI
jgi:putative ABC transport system ATP-binding protein